ncbi:MAG: IMP cyclohydrolase [Desulfobacterota bacterium]|nr:IMP cyclohydrolase [Thermodesulfobacteriota bacterium]
MATDVSSFKDVYKTAVQGDFPTHLTVTMGTQTVTYTAVSIPLRYGTNPHQPFAAYVPINSTRLCIGNLEMLKGGKDGLSLTNLQDMSQAINILKYFNKPACTIMKHVNPCGFKVQTHSETLEQIYRIARACDERSAFGGIVGFNVTVDAPTAEAIMETFIEGVVAPAYEEEAIAILRRNEGTKKLNNAIRVACVTNMQRIPKFVGDNIDGLYTVRSLVDGTLTFEIPYLTRIRSVSDFICDPMIPNKDPSKNNGQDFVVARRPTEQELEDCLTAWYVNINVRSNGIVFVKDGAAIAVGTGEQERIGAVEQAIDKAIKKGHSLRGAVMSSDAFFPQRDCIDAVAAHGVTAVVWPAGSLNDAAVIQAANDHGIALIATLERCFLHI